MEVIVKLKLNNSNLALNGWLTLTKNIMDKSNPRKTANASWSSAQQNVSALKRNMSMTKHSEIDWNAKGKRSCTPFTLKEMRNHAHPGMTTKQLDNYGGQILNDLGAKSAPYLTYGFPGWTCISINNDYCHRCYTV